MAYAVQGPNGRYYLVNEGGKGDDLSAVKFRRAQRKLDPKAYAEDGGSRRSSRRSSSRRPSSRPTPRREEPVIPDPDRLHGSGSEGLAPEPVYDASAPYAGAGMGGVGAAIPRQSSAPSPEEQTPRKPIQYDAFPSERGLGESLPVSRMQPAENDATRREAGSAWRVGYDAAGGPDFPAQPVKPTEPAQPTPSAPPTQPEEEQPWYGLDQEKWNQAKNAAYGLLQRMGFMR